MTEPGRQVSKVTVRVRPDTDGFGKEVKAYLERLEKTLELKIPVVLDDRLMARQLEKLEAKMKTAVADGLKIPIQFEGGQPAINRLFTVFSRGAQDASRKQSGLNNSVNAGTGLFRGLAQAIGNSLGIFGSLGRFAGGAAGSISALTEAGASGAGSMAKFGSALGLGASALVQLVTYAALASAVVGALGIALAAIAPLVLGISGTIAGLGTIIGVIALGVDGIKEAAKAAKPAFDELKKAVSDTFQTTMTPIFQRLNDNVIPKMRDGFVRVAEAISRVFSDLVGVVESERGLMRLNQIIRNTEFAVSNLSPVLRTVMETFLQLAATASLAFDNFVKGPLKRVVEDFGLMVDRLSENNTLLKAFDGLGFIVEGLLFLLTDLVEVGALLAAQWGPEIGESFKKFGAAVRESEPQIGRLVGQLLAVADWVSEHLPGILEGLADFADVLGAVALEATDTGNAIDADKMFADLAGPKWQTFADDFAEVFGNIAGAIKDFLLRDIGTFDWAGLGDLLKSGLDTALSRVKDSFHTGDALFEPEFMRWAESVDWAGVLAKIGEGLTWVWQQIGAFVSGETPAGSDIANPISSRISRWIDESGDAVFAKIGEWAPQFWGWVTDALFGGEAGTTAGSIGLGQGFQQKIMEMINAGRAILPLLPAMIGEFFTQAKTVAFNIASGIVIDLVSKWDQLKAWTGQKYQEIKQAISDRLTEARLIVGERVNSIGAAIRDGFQRAADWAREKLAQFGVWVAIKLDEAVAYFQALPGRIWDALSGLASQLWQAGADAGQSFVDGLKSKAYAVGLAAWELAKAAGSYLVGRSPTELGPLSGRGWTLYGGIAIGEALAAGMLQTRADVARAALELAHVARPDVDAALGNLRARFSAGIDEFDPNAPSESLYQAVFAALNGVRLRIDGNGVARLVNDANALGARR